MDSPENTNYDPNEFKAAEKVILRWDSTVSEDARERMIFDGDRNEVDRYLHAVDEIQRSLQSTSISPEDPNKVNGAIQIAMARLEDEFRNILLSHSNPSENDSVYDPFSGSSTRRSDSAIDFEDFSVEEEDNDSSAAATAGGEESLHLGGVGGESSNSRSGSGGISRSHRSANSSYRSTDSIREIELMPYDVIDDLRSIAERMIVAGYSRECIQVYASARKHVIDSNFKRIGVEKLSIGDIQRLDWETLETKIRRWIRAAKMCIRVVFASEKRLCEQIFSDLGTDGEAEEACFVETVKGPAAQLFNFAEAISISRRSTEKLFKILDLHDALVDLLIDMEVIFESKASEFIRVQAAEIVSRLAEAARGILSEFESAVIREPSKIPVPGGTIHPLTRYVMNYISLITDYKQTLTELIVSKPSTGSNHSGDLPTPDMEFADLDEKTPLELHLIWIIVILQFNLDGKSKHYKDLSLAHLFMMNNIHYIVQKVKGLPELRAMIEDGYLRKLSGKYIQAATGYQRATWVRVLNCLRDEGLHVSGSFSSGVSKSALRERFKTFNAMFEDVHRIQATWLIPDPQLREELRISVLEKLIPAYRSFLGRFRSHIESGRHPENYIKFSVEDLENAVLDFFEGYPVSQHLKRRASAST